MFGFILTSEIKYGLLYHSIIRKEREGESYEKENYSLDAFSDLDSKPVPVGNFVVPVTGGASTER